MEPEESQNSVCVNARRSRLFELELIDKDEVDAALQSKESGDESPGVRCTKCSKETELVSHVSHP